jgi:hypothetical protein
MSRQHTSNIICHIILYIKKVKMIYLTHIISNPISSVTSSCILKKVKMIYLTHIIFNSNSVFTVLFYMTRWTKPDHTCIYFQNNLNYLSVALNLYRPFVAAESIAWTFFIFRSNKIHISPTGIVSSLSPPWCHLSSDRCCHAATSCCSSFPWSQDELDAFDLSFGNTSSWIQSRLHFVSFLSGAPHHQNFTQRHHFFSPSAHSHHPSA